MKKFILFFAVLLLLSLNLFAQKAAVKPDPAKPVRDVFEKLVEGIRQNDVEKIMGVYESSPRTLFFNNNGSATIGWENMKANRESISKKTSDVTLEITGLRVEMLSKTSAYVSCKWKQAQVSDGKVENASGRMTLVFKLIGKDWKVVHLHTSPDNAPVDRPVLDSERIAPIVVKP